MFRNQPRSTAACLLFLLVCCWMVFGTGNWKERRLLNWDVSGYYLYLPAIFIHQDIRELAFYPQIDAQYQPSGADQHEYGFYRHPATGHRYLKYTCGVALFEAPAFLVAHAYCRLSGHFPADGYSAPYQLAMLLSGVLFGFLGLLVLRRLLLDFVGDAPAALALLVIGVGTNLLAYASLEGGLSHVYLFFLYALVLQQTPRFYGAPGGRGAAVLGLAIGFCMLIRPTDVLIVLVPLLWGVYERRLAAERLRFLRRHTRWLLAALCTGFLPISLQLLYWKATTGHWVFDSYSEGHDSFAWNDPKILEGLFSYRKGWFLYTPLALLGFYGAVRMSARTAWRFYALPFWLYFVVTIYVVFSWKMWWYGGSFGCRALLQSLALLALPVAYLFQHAKRRGQQWLLGCVVVFGIGFNGLKTWQWQHLMLPHQGLNEAYYWRIFLKTEASEEDKRLL